MRNLIVLVILIFCFNSCTSIIKNAHGTNKYVQFNDLGDYRNYISTKYKVDINKVYYIAKDSYNRFCNLVVAKKVDYFYGAYTNDTTEVQKSDYLKENESCLGRVIKEINSSPEEQQFNKKIKNFTFKEFSFLSIVNNTPFEFLNNGKKKIFLIYSYKTGTLRMNDFIQIENLIKSTSNRELVIITIDDVFDLPK